MNKLKENSNGKLRSVQGLMEETNMRRAIVMQIAAEAGAIIRFGKRGIRIDTEKFFAYLRKDVS